MTIFQTNVETKSKKSPSVEIQGENKDLSANEYETKSTGRLFLFLKHNKL